MKKRNMILTASAVLFITVLSVGTLLKHDVDFSENENRYLEQRPDFTVKAVLEGKFESDYEEYLSDQILGREGWVRLKGMTEAALGINDMNGVYLCRGGRVVERITQNDFNEQRFASNLREAESFIRSCIDRNISANVMLVPTAAYIYESELPQNALVFDENKAYEKAHESLGDSLLDIRNTLMAKKKGGNIFFKTDHHWTGYGAFAAYEEFARICGIDCVSDYDEMEPQILSDEFKGTLYSKVLLNTLETDIIETPAFALKADYGVEIDGEKYDSLYFSDFLKKKDKYAVYFGGNYDRVDIKINDEDTEGEKEKLLIIKDSFANSFVPYLLNDFSEITMIDTRFFRDDIQELAGEYDRVLLLYSINNFASEKIVLSGSLMR